MMLIKLGYRTYEINDADVSKVRSIWATHTGTQNEFEDVLESSNIDFNLEL